MDMIRTITLKGHNSRVTTRLRGVIPGCIQPETVKSLLDVENCLPYSAVHCFADQYCTAIKAYLNHQISYESMRAVRNNAGKIRPVA